MERKPVSGIMLTLLLIGMLTLAFNIQPLKADPKTVYVDDDNIAGPWDGSPEHPYQSITSALEHASVNDTIYVYNGTYYENVVVNKTVSLIGENEHNTIIDGSGVGTVIEVTANNVNICGFTIQNSGPYPGARAGIYVNHSSGIDINHNIITNNSDGIWLEYSSNNTVSGNTISSNDNYGIRLFDHCTNNTVSGNTVSNNHDGIYLWFYCDNNTVSGNTISNNLHAIYLYNFCRNNTLIGNTASNGWIGVYIDYHCGNSIIYHNNFLNNSVNNARIPTYEIITWDDGYPSGGNYWSDYTGVDLFSDPYQNMTGCDGIGDTPYVIDEYNQDNYPLMEPWSAPTMMKTLIRTVRSWNLHKGTENSLTSKLEGALRLLDIGKKNGAVHKLMAFINQVEALSGKKLAIEQAEYQISEAQRIIDLIEG